MAKFTFNMPDIGEGIAEAEIVQWHKQVGDTITEDEEFVDMMTDKATVEMESPVAGTVVELAGEGAADAMVAAMNTPQAGAGTPEQLIEAITQLRNLGCQYLICYFPEAAYDRSGIDLFEREVIPAIV